jgi:energy-coupling factor transporter ATP-binding protein EcfA2
LKSYLEDLTPGELIELKGETGSGKTTIFEAIYWLLYGKLRKVSSAGRRTLVSLETKEFLIQRTRNELILKFYLPEKSELKDKEAQYWIDKNFGNEEDFLSSCYFRQGSNHLLFSGTSEEKFNYIQRLTFENQEEPSELLEFLKDTLKKLGIQIAKLEAQVESGRKLVADKDFSSYIGPSEREVIKMQIKHLKKRKLLLELKEEVGNYQLEDLYLLKRFLNSNYKLEDLEDSDINIEKIIEEQNKRKKFSEITLIIKKIFGKQLVSPLELKSFRSQIKVFLESGGVENLRKDLKFFLSSSSPERTNEKILICPVCNSKLIKSSEKLVEFIGDFDGAQGLEELEEVTKRLAAFGITSHQEASERLKELESLDINLLRRLEEIEEVPEVDIQSLKRKLELREFKKIKDFRRNISLEEVKNLIEKKELLLVLEKQVVQMEEQFDDKDLESLLVSKQALLQNSISLEAFLPIKKTLEENEEELSKLKRQEEFLLRLKHLTYEAYYDLLESTVSQLNFLLNKEVQYLFSGSLTVEFVIDKERERNNLRTNIILSDLDLNFKDLSGGEKSRLNLALYLVLGKFKRSKMLFLDEILSSLDLETKSLALERIKKRVEDQEDLLAIFSMHEGTDAFADKVLVIRRN